MVSVETKWPQPGSSLQRLLPAGACSFCITAKVARKTNSSRTFFCVCHLCAADLEFIRAILGLRFLIWLLAANEAAELLMCFGRRTKRSFTSLRKDITSPPLIDHHFASVTALSTKTVHPSLKHQHRTTRKSSPPFVFLSRHSFEATLFPVSKELRNGFGTAAAPDVQLFFHTYPAPPSTFLIVRRMPQLTSGVKGRPEPVRGAARPFSTRGELRLLGAH